MGEFGVMCETALYTIIIIKNKGIFFEKMVFLPQEALTQEPLKNMEAVTKMLYFGFVWISLSF